MKYICLDIGNVLCNVNLLEFISNLSSIQNISLEEAEYFTHRSQKLHDLGLTSMKEELKNHFNVKSPLVMELLLKSWDDCIKPELQFLDYFCELLIKYKVKNDDLKIALLSNIGIEHASLMKEVLNYGNFYDLVHVKYFSCFIGARKPSLLYYQSFLSMYPEFKGALYIDDLKDNLVSSQQFGFQTYHFSLDDMKALPTFAWDVSLKEIGTLIDKNP